MDVHVFKNPEELSVKVAEWIIEVVTETLKKKSRFSFLLSGGNTPRQLYKLLATYKYQKRIDWTKMDIFFGDERLVPFNDIRNNGKMAFDALLNKIQMLAGHVHYIDTNKAPETSAAEYEQLLKEYFNKSDSTFDIALLGLGDDGHTLSIFPELKDSLDLNKWVIPVYVPAQEMYRISLTPTVVNQSKNIAFLVTGQSKAPVLQKILDKKNTSINYPAQLVTPTKGTLHWFVDEAAVSK